MMEGVVRKISGCCRAEICGAFPENAVNACAANGVMLYQTRRIDDYTLSVWVSEKEYRKLDNIAEKNMCTVEKHETVGGSNLLVFAKKHIAVIMGLAFALALLCLSSLFIWDIDVYGCVELSEGEVLRALSECGVDCGTYWPSISTELVRASMLTRLPELAWMTVNVSSSRAVVLVSERLEKPEIYVESLGADLVARREGIVRHVSVKNGAPTVGIGQSVTAGELLITGGMESATQGVRVVRAQGEVIADTWHELTAVSPIEREKKISHGLKYARYALKLGKNRINFYFNGGNTVDECDKIVHNYKIGVGRLFAMPITFIVEEFIPYNTTPEAVCNYEAMGERLQSSLENCVKGDILSCSLTHGESNGVAVVTLRAACRENIAQLIEYA